MTTAVILSAHLSLAAHLLIALADLASAKSDEKLLFLFFSKMNLVGGAGLITKSGHTINHKKWITKSGSQIVDKNCMLGLVHILQNEKVSPVPPTK